MRDADGGGVFLDVLPALAGGAEDVDAEVIGIEIDLGGALDLRQDLHQ